MANAHASGSRANRATPGSFYDADADADTDTDADADADADTDADADADTDAEDPARLRPPQ